jgi:hypothetical protein
LSDIETESGKVVNIKMDNKEKYEHECEENLHLQDISVKLAQSIKTTIINMKTLLKKTSSINSGYINSQTCSTDNECCSLWSISENNKVKDHYYAMDIIVNNDLECYIIFKYTKIDKNIIVKNFKKK